MVRTAFLSATTNAMGEFQPVSWDAYANPLNPGTPTASSSLASGQGCLWIPELYPIGGVGVLWRFDTTALTWTQLSAPVGLAPYGKWRDVAIGPDGAVYIVEDGDGGNGGGVVRYDPGTATWSRIYNPVMGDNPRLFCVVFDRDGHMYVSDGRFNIIYRVSVTGELLWSVGGWGRPMRLAVDSGSRLWVYHPGWTPVSGNDSAQTVAVFEEGGQAWLDYWSLPTYRPNNIPPEPFPDHYCGSMEIGPDGDVYAVASGNADDGRAPKILRFRDAARTNVYDFRDIMSPYNSSNPQLPRAPLAIAVGPDGTMYLSVTQMDYPELTDYGCLATIRPGAGPGGEWMFERHAIGSASTPFLGVCKLVYHGGYVWGVGSDSMTTPSNTWLHRVNVGGYAPLLTPAAGKALKIMGVRVQSVTPATPQLNMRFQTLELKFAVSNKYVFSTTRGVANGNFTFEMPQYFGPSTSGYTFKEGVQGAVNEPLSIRGFWTTATLSRKVNFTVLYEEI